jgi:hypothetical protein
MIFWRFVLRFTPLDPYIVSLIAILATITGWAVLNYL